MSSDECLNCLKLNEVISEQKSKINLIEKRLNGLVNAYKRVCVERDNLLVSTSSALLPLNDSHEQQKRIITLETRVAEMSSVCGDYELQKIKDKKLIEELTQKYEQMASDLVKSPTILQETVKETDPHKTFKSRGIQTEESIEWTNDESNDLTEEVVSEPQIIGRDVETQTDFLFESDVFNANNRKKCELAVVLPTVSEPQQQNVNQSDEELSIQSPTSSQNSDNYPVFSSDEKGVQQNDDKTYSAPNPSGVSLFYANELARKEIDLAETRLQAREYECALREIKWKYNTEKYRLQSRINELEKNFSQINCYQPMSQLNITYIRNVLIKLLNTKDKQQKQFMINAILTALEATDRKPK